MNRLTRQTGAIDLQLMFTVLMGAFIMICLIKLAPVYVDHWTIREAFTSVQEEIQSGNAKAAKKDIRAALDRRFTVNRIDQLATKDVEVIREKTRLLVKAPYEVRVPLLFNVDAVIKFTNTGFEVPLTGG